jgi:hypothetical protein
MTKSDNHNEQFFALLSNALATQKMHKLLLSKYRGSEKDLQRLVIRPIILRNETALSFVYSYKTRDITKNLSPEEGLATISTLLPHTFKSAHLLTDTEETQLTVSKKGKTSIHTSKLAQQSSNSEQQHNREKNRYVDINRPFLTALGVTDQQQQLIPAMSRKWKQINKFIEIFSQALANSSLANDKAIQVVDFGSGKGYLTFALHDYLRHSLHNKSLVTGVELRESLASLCNSTAATLEDGGLEFVCGDVVTHAPANIDVMIALHACDTATDYAIHYGIRAQAAIIMCSPCCHKQLRPQLKSPDPLKPMLKYGVHLGQQAEMLTDSLRALLLEANGYRTKVFEFVSLEHTNKNKMILAVKQKNPGDKQAVLEQIAAIKGFYGIDEHCLETLLEDNGAQAL